MHRRFAFALVVFAAPLACAAPSLAPIPPSHPASPSAPEAVLVPASNALAPESDAEAAQVGRGAAPAPSGDHGGHHAH